MGKRLLGRKDVKKAIRIGGPLGDIIAVPIMRILGLPKINRLYSKVSQYYGFEFASHLLETMNIKYRYSDDELDYIPQEGPAIVVCNHPYGGIDGVAVFDLIGKVRKDVKILTNFILSYIPNLADDFLPVNPFSDKPDVKSSFSGLRAAKEHLENGGLLVLFPSGEVSTYYRGSKMIRDKDWQPSMIKFIRNSGCPVVPVYFDGANSRMFHILGKIHPFLRTLRLPGELTNKVGASFRIAIGKPIKPLEFQKYDTNVSLGKYLKNRVYALEANIPDDEKTTFQPASETGAVPVDKRRDEKLLLKDIESLLPDSLLYEVASYQCFLAEYDRIPNIMHEIGRTREEAFRAVGEGTGKSIDMDIYDSYYRHLFIWDKDNRRIVGAYRLGIGSEIMAKYGKSGFYTDTLFRYSDSVSEYLHSAMELGRSYTALEYRKENLPLMLLIKGLLFSVMKFGDVRFMLGPVSISSWYPVFYQSLMVNYIRKRHQSEKLAPHVSPVHPFKENYLKVRIDGLGLDSIDTVERFDRFMQVLSNGQYRLPTLLKKYLKLNAVVAAFNVDPDFNYCLDGLIALDITRVPKEEILMLSKDREDKDSFLRRFGMK